jgi:undecaprenyl-diphosphatase
MMRKDLGALTLKSAILWSVPGLTLFAIGTLWFLLGGPGGMEDDILRWIAEQRGPMINGFFTGVTLSGEFYFTLPLTIIFLVILASSGRKKLSMKLLVVGIFLNLMTLFLKVITARERPDEATWLVATFSSSFPSGHCIVAVSLYSALMISFWSIRPRSFAPVFAAWFLFSILMGVSRLFVGVHYPSDVVAGLGISYALFPFLQLMIYPEMNKPKKFVEE